MPSRSQNNETRVILLLDLDSFYAQCECIRLGFDASKTALALLQWNSVLAVTYPARTQFGVKRGDSWQVIKEKVIRTKQQQQQQNQGLEANPSCCDTCHAIHVPLLTTERVMTAAISNRELPHSLDASPKASDASPHKELYSSVTSTKFLSFEEEYSSIFELSEADQQACRQRELGVRRLSHEGKASIERYRIASARIFQVVHDFISRDSTIQLEKASVDEFFLDVTKAVQPPHDGDNDSSSALWNEALIQSAKEETKQSTETVSTSTKRNEDQCLDILDEEEEDLGDGGSIGDDDNELFWRGAAIALAIRRHVFETLGFTLTAGVGTNKTVAKLTASYGKPNGQAITLPSQVLKLLHQTPIGTCRNLGGKMGHQILELLQKELPAPISDASAADKKKFTVGMIAHHLTPTTLQRSLGNETAQWIFELSAYGIDKEPVVPKQDPNSVGAASRTKSLTAVKSLPNSRSGAAHTVAQAAPWIHLLASDLITRVQRDANRNGRFPRICTLQYTKPLSKTANGAGQTVTKSVRLPFPVSFQRQEASVAIEALCRSASDTLIQKEGSGLGLTRIGFTATDFAQQQNSRHSIDRFFNAVSACEMSNQSKPLRCVPQHEHFESFGDAPVSSPTKESRPIRRETGDSQNCVDLTLDDEVQTQHDREFSSVTSKNPCHLTKQAPDRCENNMSCGGRLSDEACIRSGESGGALPPSSAKVEKDLELAMKLQAQYDREDRGWQRLDRPKNKKLKTIDSFFSCGKIT